MEEAGANLAAITYHFGSKDDLIAAALAAEIDRLVEPALAALEAKGPASSRLAEARDGDAELIAGCLSLMARARADFTLSWRYLADAVEAGSARLDALFDGDAGLADWLVNWRSRLAVEGADPAEVRARMLAVNPLYIPRNHLVQEMIEAAYRGEFGPFEALMQVLSRPFDEQAGREAFTLPPEPDQMVERTFCGT